MAGFIQIIEIRTSRIDEVRGLVDEYRSTLGDDNTARRSSVTEDRDNPGTYLNIVQFDSYESAMKNSARPATTHLAEQLAKLCDAPPRYRNLDVIEVNDF